MDDANMREIADGYCAKAPNHICLFERTENCNEFVIALPPGSVQLICKDTGGVLAKGSPPMEIYKVTSMGRIMSLFQGTPGMALPRMIVPYLAIAFAKNSRSELAITNLKSIGLNVVSSQLVGVDESNPDALVRIVCVIQPDKGLFSTLNEMILLDGVESVRHEEFGTLV